MELDPPTSDQLVAHVAVTTSGTISLDSRPGEAFKLLMLSSMHESSTVWDSATTMVGSNEISIPDSGWIVSPPGTTTQHFGLIGGTSTWKTNAPTVTIDMTGSLVPEVTGWVTVSSNPNDDNVGLWGASEQVETAWAYQVTVSKAP
jgi:hypothetical protein